MKLSFKAWKTSVRELGAFWEEILWEAVRHDQEAVVQMLLAHGTDVNALPYADGRVHGCDIKIAASQGYHHLVRALLDHRADLDCESQSPIIAAAQGGHEEVVQLLLEMAREWKKHVCRWKTSPSAGIFPKNKRVRMSRRKVNQAKPSA